MSSQAVNRLLAHMAAEDSGCAVYKNCDAVEAALAGETDLDLLVTADKLPDFRTHLAEEGGIQGYPNPLYDNAIPEREDWFVPIDGARMMHFDLANAIMAGPKFHKRYRILEYSDLTLEDVAGSGLKSVTPAEEARIALLRAAFHYGPFPMRRWLCAEGQLARVIAAVFPQDTQEFAFPLQLGEQTLICPVRKSGAEYLIDARAMRTIRKTIRQHCGVGSLAAAGHWLVHFGRRASFALLRRMTRNSPARAVHKRRLSKGCIVALIGPDGVGKSTQTERLTTIFGRKFRCTSVYLGSNDGGWMKIRGKLGLTRSAAKNAKAPAASSPTQSSVSRSSKAGRSALHSLGSAAWRLVIAGNRYLGIRRARRLASSGALVITDRWPQHFEPGILDGPSAPPAERHRLARLIWRLEKRIYRAMDHFAPDLALHLDCDFATSFARKPGDIEREDFERRIALMEKMRAGTRKVTVVDAKQDLDDVTSQLFQAIWRQLSRTD